MHTEELDVIVIGAGISGIDAACHLKEHCPDRSFAVLEGRDAIGGTWDLFRYPGIRSDSDMYTFGYGFKPWRRPETMAAGSAILDYLDETVAEHGIDRHIRFGHRVAAADWSNDDRRWRLSVERTDGGEPVELTCGFLFMCSGYYSYEAGYTPELPGRDRFGGIVVHPQEWPEDLDYTARRVVVIGSGATAVTLVPAMAPDVEHITMLQRSPSYVVSRPSVDTMAQRLRKVLPERVAHAVVRKRNTALGEFFYNRTRTHPEAMKRRILDGVREHLGEDFDVDTHFTPSYDPWDQRLCLVPDGDLFEAIRSGKASVVTATIDTFTETGIRLTSGEELAADIIVTATGLQLVTIGDMDFLVDGRPVDFSETWTYKGLAYSDVPNMVSTFGYINASWTLRADLVCDYVCRLLNHMRAIGATVATPRLRSSDRDMAARPWIDDFSSGYMQRMMPKLPKQGDREPWLNAQRYSIDRKMIGRAPIDDGVMVFT